VKNGCWQKNGTSIYVDRNDDGTDTGARYKKKSFNWYKNVIATNGEDLNG
jgi:6-phospho-beta-glucosidase